MSGNNGRSVAIIGGGAAGYFAALTAAECDPSAKVTMYESSRKTLTKVKISGGGRCNVTHSCFDPKQLVKHYPRGHRELLGAFHRWQPQDTIRWFGEHGVELKTESDGRMFPTTDESQTIIDCFEKNAAKQGIRLIKNVGLEGLAVEADGQFALEFNDGSFVRADKICIATGSLKNSKLVRSLEALGHSIEPLAPSLFAFNLADKRTHGLSGLAVQNASISVCTTGGTTSGLPRAGKDAATPKSKQSGVQTGPILITHRGISGPAVLKLSAWEARELQQRNYHFDVTINWLGDVSENQLRETFKRLRKGKTQVKSKVFEEIPRRLWESLVKAAGIADETKWAQLPKDQETALIRELTAGRFSVLGKTTNKDDVNISHAGKITRYYPEFVTCGGVSRKEIDWRTMESKLIPNLHFAGECIDYDGITGGFNFQGAWTTGRIAGEAMAHDD